MLVLVLNLVVVVGLKAAAEATKVKMVAAVNFIVHVLLFLYVVFCFRIVSIENYETIVAGGRCLRIICPDKYHHAWVMSQPTTSSQPSKR